MPSAVAVPSSVMAPKLSASLTWKRSVRTATAEKRPSVGSATRSGFADTAAPSAGARCNGAGVLSVEPSAAAPVVPAAAAEGEVGEPDGALQAARVAHRAVAPSVITNRVVIVAVL